MADESHSQPSTPPAGPRAAPGRRTRPPRAPGAYLRLPIWQRFLLAGVIAVVLLVAMVIYVDNNNTNSNPSLNPATEVRANREAETLVRQDQAPHTVILRSHLASRTALEQAIHARMAAQVAAGAIDGPAKAADCRQSGSPRGGRTAFTCAIFAGAVSYPFLGVVDSGRHQMTYCKRDPPPSPSDNVPVSPRCRL